MLYKVILINILFCGFEYQVYVVLVVDLLVKYFYFLDDDEFYSINKYISYVEKFFIYIQNNYFYVVKFLELRSL